MTDIAAPADIGALRTAGERRARTALALAAALLGVVCVAGVMLGPVPLTPGDVADVVAARLGIGTADRQAVAIVELIRLPRVVLGLAVGAALGIGGAVMQALFRNPLADPGIIGISGGAAAAAAFTIVLGGALMPGAMATLGPFALPVAAFAGALGAMALVAAAARSGGLLASQTMLLAGIAVNALAAAIVGYLTFLSTDEQMRTLTFWTLGSLGGATWERVVPAAALCALSCAALVPLGQRLDGLLLGERAAGHLGIDVERLKRRIVIAATLGVGAAVAVTGIIGFIGLLAPHLVRSVAGARHRIVLPGSALAGALLVTSADCVARLVAVPAELPIGVLTAAIGAPLFLWRVTRQRGLPA